LKNRPPEKMEEFCRMLSVATGLRVDETHRESIERAVANRMTALDVGTGDEYAEILGNPETMRAEVEAVIPDVMCSDTAFFRSREHFELLRERVIPEILQRVGTDRSVRIWDAGCATGEETYSSAILLDMYFKRFADAACIMGTDINSNAIDTAVAGVYGPKSVDGLDSREMGYFIKSEAGYELKPRVKDLVRFLRHNLIEDLPTWNRAGLSNMDVVVCRDVLLYFQPEIAQRVIIQFYESMAPGGYLLLGPAEGMLTVHSPFEHCVYEQTVYCRKQLLGHGRVIPFFTAH
jgi:chemotaxis protein methyltransferase CheR